MIREKTNVLSVSKINTRITMAFAQNAILIVHVLCITAHQNANANPMVAVYKNNAVVIKHISEINVNKEKKMFSVPRMIVSMAKNKLAVDKTFLKV